MDTRKYPYLDEQGNQFSFLEFLYDTNVLQLQNSYATETTSPAYPQNAATMHSRSEETDSWQGPARAILRKFKLLKRVAIKQGRRNPRSQTQIAIMLWVPYEGM